MFWCNPFCTKYNDIIYYLCRICTAIYHIYYQGLILHKIIILSFVNFAKSLIDHIFIYTTSIEYVIYLSHKFSFWRFICYYIDISTFISAYIAQLQRYPQNRKMLQFTSCGVSPLRSTALCYLYRFELLKQQHHPPYALKNINDLEQCCVSVER